jgi:hypothetical protein
MNSMRRIALVAVALLVTAASVASLAESYRALVLWALKHGLHGVWAAGFPLQVDVFLVVGELTLFIALVDRWPLRARLAAWAVTLTGLAISVAGNVGHVGSHLATSRATAAIPPLAAAAALAVGLGVLKRAVNGQYEQESAVTMTAREVAMARSGERAYGGALAASVRALEADRKRREKADKQAGKERTLKPSRRPVSVRSRGRSKEAAVSALVSAPDMTGEELARRFGGTGRTHRRWREDARELAAAADGHGG